MKAVGDDFHKLGLKFGIYTVVGLGFDVYRDGNTPIYNAPGCFTRDIVYPDLRTTNGWDQAYKINYESSCAQKYADSIARPFADWALTSSRWTVSARVPGRALRTTRTTTTPRMSRRGGARCRTPAAR
jgi:hypothetical protein